jgi:hypothetical protein
VLTYLGNTLPKQSIVRHPVQMSYSYADQIQYIRQRDSYSRLQISKDVFRVLAQGSGVFPHLLEFLIDFKWKDREIEVDPPRIKFRPTSPQSRTIRDFRSGFGNS